MMNSEDPLSAYPPVPLAKRHQPENNINDFNAVVALDVSAGLNTASLIAATADGQCFSLDLSVPMPQPGRMVCITIIYVLQVYIIQLTKLCFSCFHFTPDMCLA
jgi:hypothetical protein